MMQDMRTQKPAAPHNIIMQNRSRLTVSGVEDVLAFDEAQIDTQTSAGMLLIKGEGLHIDAYSTESGELTVTGNVDELIYSAAQNRREGFFSRVFR